VWSRRSGTGQPDSGFGHQDAELSRRLAALQFVVDTVHGFQGDERDAMFFSPVVSAGSARVRCGS